MPGFLLLLGTVLMLKIQSMYIQGQIFQTSKSLLCQGDHLLRNIEIYLELTTILRFCSSVDYRRICALIFYDYY